MLLANLQAFVARPMSPMAEAPALPFDGEEDQSALVAQRQQMLADYSGLGANPFPHLYGERAVLPAAFWKGNIENYVGQCVVPVGVVGPLHVQGSCASGAYYIPLATTEGALVASYHRGARATKAAGGIASVSVAKSVQRCPSFQFGGLRQLAHFVLDTESIALQELQAVAQQTSTHTHLLSFEYLVEGRQLLLVLDFNTADAAGQNMITLCAQQICLHIISKASTPPETWYLESNFAGDKKATARNLSRVRGQRVVSEAVLPQAIIASVLKADGAAMERYYLNSTLAAAQCGSIGAQGHYANGLAALFLATGQDVATVSEAAMGITRMEYDEEKKELYASVTLPNLICGTVGGGTHLPTQLEALQLMDCAGEGQATKYAEIAAALVLCGELSIAAALSAGHFAAAHARFRPSKQSNI